MTEALISTRRNGAVINQAFKLFGDAPLPSQFGFVMVSAYIFVAVFAPALAPYAETEIVGDHYEAWSEAFPLGTDHIGRDMLTRMIYGARNTIGIAFVAASLGFLGGGVAGMLAAMLGGWTDQVLSRINDILMAIPGAHIHPSRSLISRYLDPGVGQRDRTVRGDARVSRDARGRDECRGDGVR